ncbi:MAG: hypothetical protein EPN17_17890 [Methylobacter sp.]|nr:MAG: hypothetical protein EPN17_17890 [Methylobacter sp.]
MTTMNPLNGLLAINDGYTTARWNFPDAVGTLAVSPGGIGNAAEVGFSFLTAVPSYYATTNFSTAGFARFSGAQKQAVRDVLASVADVVQLSFIERSAISDITFALNTQPANTSGYGFFPSFGYSSSSLSGTISSVTTTGLAGDVWINGSQSWTAADFALGGSGYGALVHEVGHALGLKHPFEESGTGGDHILDASLDSTQYTVMSYTKHSYSLYRTVTETSPNQFAWSYKYILPETLMPLDIKALQYLYGANTSSHSGDDIYTFDTSRPFIKTIWDGGGNDTLSVANFSLACVLDLRDGDYSSISIPSGQLPEGSIETNPGIYDGTDNLAIAYDTIIENAIGGSGDDRLIGNAVANVLDGGLGADTMLGGDGSDIYSVDNSGDVVTESNAKASTGGVDLVNSYLSDYALGASIENARIVSTSTANLTGNNLNNTLTGNVAANILIGNAGADELIGGGGADSLSGGLGADILTGGKGADRFIFLKVNDSGLSSSSRDTIADFKASENDKIDFSAIDANTGNTGNNAFVGLKQGSGFIGSFADSASLYFDQAAKILYGNNDADVQADFSIQLTGVTGVSLGDFIL